MRSVFDTLLKPEWVLSATGHSTEWISTNTRLPAPRPNQINASGNSAIAGSGLNIAVMVSRKSVPSLLEIANTVSKPARKVPDAKPIIRTWIELHARFGMTPLPTSAPSARTASLNGGAQRRLAHQQDYS